jgi:hypothetical protein
MSASLPKYLKVYFYLISEQSLYCLPNKTPPGIKRSGKDWRSARVVEI